MAICSPQSLAELRSVARDNPNVQATGGFQGAAAYPPSMFAGVPYGCPDDCVGDHFYGLISALIPAAGAAGSTGVLITTQPQVRNQPRRLFLTETVADNFLINDIKVGQISLLATPGAISASVFVPNAICPDFRRQICEVSQFVTVEVSNVSGAAATFASTMSAYILA